MFDFNNPMASVPPSMLGQRGGIPQPQQGGYGAPQGPGITLGGFPAQPPVPPMQGPPAGTPGAGPPIGAPPMGGGGNQGGGFGSFGGGMRPNIDAFKAALMGWRTDMRDWRGQRPQGGDQQAMMDWRGLRPDHPDFRAALFGTAAPAPGNTGVVPPAMGGSPVPQGPAGAYGTQLGVIGASGMPSSNGLPTY